MPTLGKRIKKRREALGLTLLDVAKAVGVSEATIQRYESGDIKNPKQPRIAALARALHVDANYLMGWDEQPPARNQIELTDEEWLRIKKFRAASPEIQAAAEAILELDQNVRRVLDTAEDEE